MPSLPVAPHVEVAGAADVATLSAMRREAGWIENQWLLRFLSHWSRARLLVVRGAGPPAGGLSAAALLGTTLATVYGAAGVIGNVIVREDLRGRGYGKLLMLAALDWMREQGARVATLDATKVGQPLYRRVGFVGVGNTWEVWHPLRALTLDGLLEAERLRIGPLVHDAVGSIAALDRTAFGGDRLELLAGMLARPEMRGLLARDASGELAGYLIARPLEAPRAGLYIGPLVSNSPEVAQGLMVTALRQAQAEVQSDASGESFVAMGLTGENLAALDLFRALGLGVQEDDLRMRADLAAGDASAGEPAASGRPDWIYGMLSAMVG